MWQKRWEVRKCRENKVLVKSLVRGSRGRKRERVDDDFGREISAKYLEHIMKKFWKEVEREWRQIMHDTCRIKGEQ